MFLTACIQGPGHFFAGILNLSFPGKLGLDLLQARLRSRSRAGVERVLDVLPQLLQFRENLLLRQLPGSHFLKRKIERLAGRLIELDTHQHLP